MASPFPGSLASELSDSRPGSGQRHLHHAWPDEQFQHDLQSITPTHRNLRLDLIGLRDTALQRPARLPQRPSTRSRPPSSSLLPRARSLFLSVMSVMVSVLSSLDFDCFNRTNCWEQRKRMLGVSRHAPSMFLRMVKLIQEIIPACAGNTHASEITKPSGMKSIL